MLRVLAIFTIFLSFSSRAGELMDLYRNKEFGPGKVIDFKIDSGNASGVAKDLRNLWREQEKMHIEDPSLHGETFDLCPGCGDVIGLANEVTAILEKMPDKDLKTDRAKLEVGKLRALVTITEKESWDGSIMCDTLVNPVLNWKFREVPPEKDLELIFTDKTVHSFESAFYKDPAHKQTIVWLRDSSGDRSRLVKVVTGANGKSKVSYYRIPDPKNKRKKEVKKTPEQIKEEKEEKERQRKERIKTWAYVYDGKKDENGDYTKVLIGAQYEYDEHYLPKNLTLVRLESEDTIYGQKFRTKVRLDTRKQEASTEWVADDGRTSLAKLKVDNKGVVHLSSSQTMDLYDDFWIEAEEVISSDDSHSLRTRLRDQDEKPILSSEYKLERNGKTTFQVQKQKQFTNQSSLIIEYHRVQGSEVPIEDGESYTVKYRYQF